MDVQKRKKQITFEEYNKLSDEEKKKYKEMHLDEQFKIAECEDVDYCWRAQDVCTDIRILKPKIVEHTHSQTLNNLNYDDEQERMKNQQRFRKKWHLDEK